MWTGGWWRVLLVEALVVACLRWRLVSPTFRHGAPPLLLLLLTDARSKQRGLDTELFASLNRTPPRPPRSAHSPVTLATLPRSGGVSAASSVMSGMSGGVFAEDSHFSSKSATDKLRRTCCGVCCGGGHSELDNTQHARVVGEVKSVSASAC